MKNFKNIFKNSTGSTPSVNKLYSITITKQKINKGLGLTIIEATISFNTSYMPPSFKCKTKRVYGRTKCINYDNYDRQTGLDIAEHKARIKAYNYIDKVFLQNVKIFNDYAQSCEYVGNYVRKRKYKQIECFNKKAKITITYNQGTPIKMKKDELY